VFFSVLGLELRAYTLSHSTIPSFLWWVFQDRVSWTICPGWLWTVILLIAASWLARIIGLSHRHPNFLKNHNKMHERWPLHVWHTPMHVSHQTILIPNYWLKLDIVLCGASSTDSETPQHEFHKVNKLCSSFICGFQKLLNPSVS
jgi:hypothetical protein